MKTKVIKMKNGQTRRVQVLANGRYRFLKGKATKRARPKATTKARKVKTMVRRRRAPIKRRARRSKKYTTISLMDIGHIAVQYSNMTGQPLGKVLDEVTQTIITPGQGDILEIMMAQVQAGVQNITENPWGIAVRAAAIAFFVNQVKHLTGRKKIFTVGRFRITS